ncbi:MAG: LptF/LptG family permease, partial [Lutibacter sp.]|nr:LptF/LptG family permease [Lutibacter sp.]
SAGKGKAKVITAEKGIISSDEGSKYMEISLENGFYFEEHILKNASAKERKRVPASKARFKKYTLNIDISSFNDDKDLDNERVKEHHGMLSIQQLSDISKEKKVAFDQDVSNRATTFFQTLEVKQLHRYHDSVRIGLTPVILDNFVPKNKRLVIDQALQLLKRLETNNKNNRKVFKSKRKLLNLYDFEYHYRISFSLACLVLFFIGAPLGAIIRKGGFGLPMVLAIFVFVTYFFIMQLGKNLAEESAISAIMGSWLATFIMLPIAFLLTRRATRGMSIVNIDNALNKIRTAFGTFKK